MRDSMDMLQSLNMKEVRVSGAMGLKPWVKGDAPIVMKKKMI